MTPFWRLEHPADRIALVQENGLYDSVKLTYGELRDRVAVVLHDLSLLPGKRVGFIFCRNSIETILMYLAALQAKHAVLLLDAELASDLAGGVIERYQPDWVFSAEPMKGYEPVQVVRGLQFCVDPPNRRLFPELGVLLSTSGTTGSPRLVRLSYANISSNAQSIAEFLDLSADERPITTLSLAYSYGLSVINSHLLVGSSILLTDLSLTQRTFWNFFSTYGATSLAGVPYTYEILLRTRMLRQKLPSLRTLTQAGGRLDPKLIEQVCALSRERGWRFFVMYGQTEATARISYVPPDRLAEKIGAIGVAIPGGSLFLDQENSELLYRGPNVMLGYAESSLDLEKGDELKGELRTGDLGRQDEDGFFYITGRMKRFLKIFGQRVSLDQIEEILLHAVNIRAVCLGSDDKLAVATEDKENVEKISHAIRDLIKLHPSAVIVAVVDRIPRLTNGKIDYVALTKMIVN